MSQQGPILVVSTARRPSFAATLDLGRLFPVVETEWADAVRAVEQVQPAAVLAATSDTDAAGLAELAARVAARQPYLPLISVDPRVPHPDNVIPFFQSQTSQTPDGGSDRLVARLRAALRVRSLHATVMRRLVPATPMALSHIDPARDATVLLIGRGGAYPTLSVALGERTGVVGALSIEAAAKHLNVRDIDGIVLGEGFSPRVVDAFLTVLTEDARFRNLPVVVTADDLAPAYDLPNLEIVSDDSAQVVSTVLPLIRQHAFEAHLSRTLKAIDADGLIDARTGLLTPEAFERDFASAIYQTQQRGGGLSVARFAFDPGTSPRAVRRRADHQPPDAANGFRRRAGGRLGGRGRRRYRSEHRPHRRTAAVQRDAPYLARQARHTGGTGCDGRNPGVEGFREVAAGVVRERRGSPRRVVIVLSTSLIKTRFRCHCRPRTPRSLQAILKLACKAFDFP